MVALASLGVQNILAHRVPMLNRCFLDGAGSLWVTENEKPMTPPDSAIHWLKCFYLPFFDIRTGKGQKGSGRNLMSVRPQPNVGSNPSRTETFA